MKIQLSDGFVNVVFSASGHGMSGKGRSFRWGMEG
jgi:hypothetical protein